MSEGHVISFDVGTRNLGVAASSVREDGTATVEWLDTADVSGSCADRCVSKLWSYLDELMGLLRWDKYAVLIERQPSKACSLMRSVELAIRHYFLMQGHTKAASVTVKSVSPRRKLSKPVIYAPGSSKAQQYKARKNAGVAEAVDAVADLPEVVDFLMTGKGDDAADALLYHIHFFGARRFVSVSEHALRNGRAKAALKQQTADVKARERQAKIDAAEAAKAYAREAKSAARAAKVAEAAALKAEKLAARAAKKGGSSSVPLEVDAEAAAE